MCIRVCPCSNNGSNVKWVVIPSSAKPLATVVTTTATAASIMSTSGSSVPTLVIRRQLGGGIKPTSAAVHSNFSSASVKREPMDITSMTTTTNDGTCNITRRCPFVSVKLEQTSANGGSSQEVDVASEPAAVGRVPVINFDGRSAASRAAAVADAGSVQRLSIEPSSQHNDHQVSSPGQHRQHAHGDVLDVPHVTRYPSSRVVRYCNEVSGRNTLENCFV